MSRPSFVSVARYTSPIPPAPNGDWISYGPSFVPGVRAIRARNYSLCSTLHADATILDVWSATLILPDYGSVARYSCESRELSRGAVADWSFIPILQPRTSFPVPEACYMHSSCYAQRRQA